MWCQGNLAFKLTLEATGRHPALECCRSQSQSCPLRPFLQWVPGRDHSQACGVNQQGGWVSGDTAERDNKHLLLF